TIHADTSKQLFHLTSKDVSYVIQIIHGYPVHLYWGARLRRSTEIAKILTTVERASFSPNPVDEDRSISLDTLPQEYPQYGTSDFRDPAYQVQLADGTRITELRYTGYRIVAGKPDLEGLPATYVEDEEEAETLVLE